MKKIKIRVFYLIFISIAIIFFLSFQIINQTSVFNGERAFSYVREFTSPEYEGRKASTEGNLKSLEFCNKILESSGYEIIRQPFTALVPFIESEPIFEILNKDGYVERSFKHRKDFKESLDGYSSDGEIISKVIIDEQSIYNKKSKLFHNSIVVVNNEYSGTEAQDLIYINAKVKAILIPTFSENIKWASTYTKYNKTETSNKKRKIIKLYISRELLYLLRSHSELIQEDIYVSKNIKIHIKMPLKFKKVQTENLIAILKNPNLESKNFNYLGFSAHIDHLGKDPDGSYFPGALDNASGVAFVLEMAKVLANYKDILTVNPLIVIFNAEENGLYGSYNFVHNPIIDLSKLQIINFDMVAYAKPRSYNILLYQGINLNHPAKKLAENIKNFGSKNNLYFSIGNIIGESDHIPFNKKGYAAVTLNQFPVLFYHTYNDTADKVSASGFDQLGKFMEKFILENYTVKKQSLYNIFIVLILFSLLFKLKSRNSNQN